MKYSKNISWRFCIKTVLKRRRRYTFGVAIFKSSNRNESRIFSCSTDRITDVIVAVVDGTRFEGDQTFPDSIFSNVGTMRLLKIEYNQYALTNQLF